MSPIPGARYQTLDAWRGVACLWVLLFHASGEPGMWGHNALLFVLNHGWAGVPIFFVISGYCISATLDGALRSGHTWWSYWMRRIRRIFPPYWIALAAIVGVVALAQRLGHGDVFTHSLDGMAPIPAPGDVGLWRWIGSSLLVEGWRAHFIWRGGPGYYLPIAWSLGYEEQFYIVAGLMLILAGHRWRELAVVLTLGVIACVILIPIEAMRGFWFDGRWLLFAYGIGVYAQRTAEGWGRWILPVGCIAGVAWGVSQPDFGPQSFSSEMVVAPVVALALALLHPHDHRIAPRMNWLSWCGVRCYSVYLLHWPIAKAFFWMFWTLGFRSAWTVLPLCIGFTMLLTLLLSDLFYRYVELPCMAPKRSRDVAPVVTTTTVSAA